MNGLIIAVFFGWLGAYRFYKKQNVIGIIYFFTFGLFGIGWVLDIISAYKEYKNQSETPVLMLDTRVMGAFAECRKDENKKRADVIQNMNIGDKIIMETALYQGAPFFLVVDKNSNLDIGALPKDLSRQIKGIYKNPVFEAELTKKDLDYPEIKLTVQESK